VGASPYVIEFRGEFSFPVPPPAVWATIERVDRFESWWAWLTEVGMEGPPLRDGSALHGVVAPPLPYRMRLRVGIVTCVPPRSIDATVSGDLVGRAQLVLDEDGTGTRVRASWTVEMMQQPMRVAARFTPRLLHWGHDRVVDATVAGFRRHLATAPGAERS
jgi:carbon monoxide dehydrogenase subunit G